MGRFQKRADDQTDGPARRHGHDSEVAGDVLEESHGDPHPQRHAGHHQDRRDDGRHNRQRDVALGQVGEEIGGHTSRCRRGEHEADREDRGEVEGEGEGQGDQWDNHDLTDETPGDGGCRVDAASELRGARNVLIFPGNVPDVNGEAWWGQRGLNPRPADYESAALTN